MQYYLLYIYTRSAAPARSRDEFDNITIIFFFEFTFARISQEKARSSYARDTSFLIYQYYK